MQVVFFDSDPQAHAPFYFYLARLGLARVVTGAVQLEVRPHVQGCAPQLVGRKCIWDPSHPHCPVPASPIFGPPVLPCIAYRSQEGKDLHHLGLSKSKSTPADWIRCVCCTLAGTLTALGTEVPALAVECSCSLPAHTSHVGHAMH